MVIYSGAHICIQSHQFLYSSTAICDLLALNLKCEIMAHIVEQQLASAAKIVEEQLDAEVERLEKMDLSDIEVIRKQRLEEMKKKATQKHEWLLKGHGELSEISSEKDFFDVCKQSENMLCHFYKDTTFRCKILDKHLEVLSKKHVEARFIKLNVDKAPFLVDKLKIKVLPCIVLVHDSIIKDRIVGFTDLGGIDEFSTEMLEWRIAHSGIIEYNGDLRNPPDALKSSKKVQKLPKKTIRGRDDDDDDDSDY